MHLIFERSKGRFKSNCNILALAWMPYYNETIFRQALFDYHQRQLINLTGSIGANSSLNDANRVADGPVQSANLPSVGGLRNLGESSGLPANSGNNNNNNNDDANQLLANSINPNQNSQNIPVRQQFLNSRIAELHQRYVYLDNVQAPSNRRAGRTLPNVENNKKPTSDMADELDRKYGRLPDFGWLVVGNIGKIVGVTLTSTLAPIQQPLENNPSSNCKEPAEDLMLFDDFSNENGATRSKVASNKVAVVIDSRATTDDQMRPDRGSARSNYNLRGHLDEVILVKWNELYQKLATIDSKGNVLIWCKINEKFTIQTPFYNRAKSVADFKWSNDGKTALICYTDSFILVGSSSGQRHWHSMLNLDDYHITCASWTPNDEQLLLGVSNGNVVVIDLPHSELTELVVNQTNIRTMCWSSCDISMRNIDDLSISSPVANAHDYNVTTSSTASTNRRNSNPRNSTVVNHRRLSRDCSVFSRYRFCSQAPSNGINIGHHRSSGQSSSSSSAQVNQTSENQLNTSPCLGTSKNNISKQRNILAIDFANNTIKLFEDGLDDPEPRTIQVNQESYIMHWSSDGKVLAVAGFTIHTTAPSVGCLRCRYLNAIKFYNQQGSLIYEHTMKYTRYPITAFTWAHDDRRLFLATGPRLHCAKVFFGIPSLSLLAVSCLQRFTKLADKSDTMESILRQHFSSNVLNWQSRNCPIDIHKESKRAQQQRNRLLDNQRKQVSQRPKAAATDSSISCSDESGGEQAVLAGPTICNNSNVYLYNLPPKLQTKIDELFHQTIRQPYDEHWSLNDIIWNVPKNDRRHYCTLVCYTSDREISSTGYQYRADLLDRSSVSSDPNHASDQNKIFVLYVEFQGSLIPVLRARRVGFLRPEFVIFDPEDHQLKSQRQRKVSDLSQESHLNRFIQRRFDNHQQIPSTPLQLRQNPSSPFYCNDGFSENCSDLHLYSEPRASSSSLTGRQSLSEVDQYYNFECDTMNRQHQDRLADLVSGRSHHQEPIALPMASNPYLMYMMSMSMNSQQASRNYLASTSDRGGNSTPMTPSSFVKHRSREQCYKSRRQAASSATSSSLTETNELIRIKSNIWGTKFKLINTGNSMIKQRSVLGSVVYKASILHLQPRQIFLNIKDMSNYCCLCSKHHHHTRTTSKSGGRLIHPSRAEFGRLGGGSDNKISLLDMPNIEPSPTPLISPVKSSRRKQADKHHLRRSGNAGSDRVILQVGDRLRIAPKLEANQEYRSGCSIVDNNHQKSSTTHRRRHKSHRSGHQRHQQQLVQKNNLEIERDRNRQIKLNNCALGPPRPNKTCILKPTVATRCPLSDSHSKAHEVFYRTDRNTHLIERLPPPKLISGFVGETNIHRSDPQDDEANDLSSDNRQEDDILTLSLDQGDQVRVQMSSLRSLNHEPSSLQAKSAKVLSGAGSSASTSKVNSGPDTAGGIDDFLATNKTLKSIQTITKMIVDLSSKANDDLVTDATIGLDSGGCPSPSPSKVAKLTWPASNASSRYIPPETPVHRPRRTGCSRLAGELSNNLNGSQARFQTTQSAHTTPLKSLSDRKAPRRRAHRSSSRGEKAEADAVLASPLPPPPSSMPIGRRLSSSAKRFIDGSLRSLYRGGYSTTTSDAEPEESEPLVVSKGCKADRTAYYSPLGKEMRQRRFMMMNNNDSGSRQQPTSQPISPMKTLISNHGQHSIDLSNSLRIQLMQKLRGQKSDGASGSTGSSSHLNRPPGVAVDGILKTSWSNDGDSSLSQELYPAEPALRFGYGSPVYSSASSSISSSSSSGLDDEDTNFDFTDSELDSDIVSSSNKTSRARKAHKFGFSSSVKDLRELYGQSIRFGQAAISRGRGEKHKQQQQPVGGRQVDTSGRASVKQQQQQQVTGSRRRRIRRKSICLNSSCCCAKEFQLQNRPPVWNELSQVYQLDFGGRVTQESAKNLQIDFEGNLALQFGRIDRCTYTLDYKYPFNAVQAMAIALASLTQRLK